MCSNDYGRILLEIDKVKHYMKATSSQDSNKAFEILLYNNAIYSDIGDITFQLTEAVIAGDLDNSFILLEKAKLSGEPVLRICSILYNNFRNMLALECLGSNKSNASARTGLDSKLTYVMLKKLGAYSIRECIRNVNICQRVESGIKTGLIEQDVAMDYLIVSLLS
jgi:DNA polymerase III delta subunit